MAFDLNSLLQQYLGASAAQPSSAASDHYQQVAQNAPPSVVSGGLADAFRSDQTPPFADMVSQMFGQANPDQKAGMLNQLINALPPGALASILGSGALGGIAGAAGAGGRQIAPQDASRVTPDQVQQIAEHAEQRNPTVIDKMSDFYAQHPALVKTLGGAALTIALAKIANSMKA
ncbi:MAG TPA: hypothetical protein VH704_04280 [Casimicrobiaceae bacterium]|jgi:hypothetical protein|nr:hypothetical protein [Casimicrobiaceae bacterium]